MILQAKIFSFSWIEIFNQFSNENLQDSFSWRSIIFNVSEILSHGAIGLGFVFIVLTYYLLKKEQAREHVRPEMLKSIKGFMATIFVMVLIVLILEFFFKYKPDLNLNQIDTSEKLIIPIGTSVRLDSRILGIEVKDVYKGVGENIYADIEIAVAPAIYTAYTLTVNPSYSETFRVDAQMYRLSIRTLELNKGYVEFRWDKIQP